jgi:adenine-specific DNA-methyltransferase
MAPVGEAAKRDNNTLVARLANPDVLLEAAVLLGACDVPGLSPAENALLARRQERVTTASDIRQLRALIVDGADPLGDAFCRVRSPQVRRPLGATYTPDAIVNAMVAWAGQHPHPRRVIDPGAGSGRFLLAAGREFPAAELVAVEIDPLAALLARANITAAGMAGRAAVVVDDFRLFRPGPGTGPTLYIGNPPYVRHHQLGPDWKDWLVQTARQWGKEASQLAGLHVHFFLATLDQAAKGDVGCYITSAEWLDVNYGSLVRGLLLDGLGGQAIHMLEPTAMPFADAATTGVITCFTVGSQPRSLRLRRYQQVDQLGRLNGGRPLRRERLAEARRWTPLLRAAPKVPDGHIELGELCRVHRGAVTGANSVWVRTAAEADLPAAVLFASVTRARELFTAGEELRSQLGLRVVVDLPVDLDVFDSEERRRIERFLRVAKRAGAADGYVARYRKAWWSVGLRSPAPILATYMARRPPAFVRNLVGARHINIAHGLYPRQPVTPLVLDRLATALRTSVLLARGRTYAGGLTKFEPREMERLPVPDLATLQES